MTDIVLAPNYWSTCTELLEYLYRKTAVLGANTGIILAKYFQSFGKTCSGFQTTMPFYQQC